MITVHQPWANDCPCKVKQSGKHRAWWVVLSDPDEEAGFRKGATFTDEELYWLLKTSAMTVGAKIDHPRMGRFVVKPDEHCQVMVSTKYRVSPMTAFDDLAITVIG